MEGVLQQLMRLRSHVIANAHIWRHAWKWTCAVVGHQQFAEQSDSLPTYSWGKENIKSYPFPFSWFTLNLHMWMCWYKMQGRERIYYSSCIKKKTTAEIWFISRNLSFYLFYSVMISPGFNGVAIAISMNNVLWMLIPVLKLWPWGH